MCILIYGALFFIILTKIIICFILQYYLKRYGFHDFMVKTMEF
jgi:hypothetical protein